MISKSEKELTRNKDVISRREEEPVRYKAGEEVLYKSPKASIPKWLNARIVKRISPYVYLIQLVPGNLRTAHGAQLKPKRKTTLFTGQRINNEKRIIQDNIPSDEEEVIGWETPPSFHSESTPSPR